MYILHQLFRVLVIVSVSGLVACTFDWRRPKDQETQVRESLEIPPDLARPGRAEATPPAPVRAPVHAPAASEATVAEPAPPVDATIPRVKLERDGSLRWLTVRGDAQGVWKQVREYLVRDEIKLEVDDPAGRVFETAWIDRPVNLGTGSIANLFSKLHSSGLRDKYRVRVEVGRSPQTAEVYVAHQMLEEIVTEGGGVQVAQTRWFPRPGDPQLEAEMLNKLMAHLDTGSGAVQTASAPAVESGSVRVQRTKDGLLLLSEDMDTAWRLVGQVLDRSGVRIEDRDRSAGIIYVQFRSSSGKEKNSVMFGWLIGDSSSDGKDQANTDRFQVALKAVEGGVRIRVNDVAGEPATSKAGQELAGLLERQLR